MSTDAIKALKDLILQCDKDIQLLYEKKRQLREAIHQEREANAKLKKEASLMNKAVSRHLESDIEMLRKKLLS